MSDEKRKNEIINKKNRKTKLNNVFHTLYTIINQMFIFK